VPYKPFGIHSGALVLMTVAGCVSPAAYSGTVATGGDPPAPAASSVPRSTATGAETARLHRLRMQNCKRHPQTCVQGAAAASAPTRPSDGGGGRSN